jgi:tRNA pseudouridine55 synthase
VRTLVEDIAKQAGTVAYTAALHREAVAGFDAGDMLDMSSVERLADAGRAELEARLLPPDRALATMPAVRVGAEDVRRFRAGQAVPAGGEAQAGLVRVYGPDGQEGFLGVGETAAGGTVAPKRVFAESRVAT